MAIPLPTYLIFLASALVLLLTPGPAVLYIITRSVHQGRKAGVVSAAGLGIGNFVQVLAATAGLSVLLVSSAFLFNVVKFAGAGYLIYLGLRTLLNRNAAGTTPDIQARPLRQIFREGIVINTLNPKVSLFFLAFLPQFIDPNQGSSALQVFILGSSFASLGILTDSLYALTAGSLGGWLKRQTRFQRAERTIAGSIYLLLGFSALFLHSKSIPE